MRPILAILLLLAAPVFAQDLVAKNGSDSVRITDQPCPVEVLKHIEQGSRGYFRAALAIVGGKTFEACWAESNGTAFIQYADGDRGMIPMAAFTDPSV